MCEGRTFCPGGCGKASDPKKLKNNFRFLFFIFSVVVVVVESLADKKGKKKRDTLPQRGMRESVHLLANDLRLHPYMYRLLV
jgi:hypothetical protein